MQELINSNPPGAPSGQPNAQPVLGAQVPGSNTEMAAKPGLTPYMDPMAQELQSYGRNGDSMLVHMTPGEVKGLQQLAMAHGGSLTVNPHTGLPEANFLKKLLPTLVGAILTPLTGGLINPMTAGLLVGGVETARTGSLSKGLMAGLGAWGGAGLSTALLPNMAGSAGRMAAGTAGEVAHLAAPTISPNALNAVGQATIPAAPAAAQAAVQATAPQGIGQVLAQGAKSAANKFIPQGIRDVGSRFATATQLSPTGTALPGVLAKAAPMAAGTGLMNSVSEALTPEPMQLQSEQKSTYEGPYTLEKQEVRFPTREEILSGGGKEFQFFSPVSPRVLDRTGMPAVFGKPTTSSSSKTPTRGRYGNLLNEEEAGGYARGGTIGLKDGSFVADARTVAEIGNGSSNAGHEVLARLGGKPVRGPGDGVSDSVPARIGAKQPARVARDEVIFPPAAVNRIGGGSNQRGAQKLYAMMDKAKAARRKADRGEDTGLRRGLV